MRRLLLVAVVSAACAAPLAAQDTTEQAPERASALRQEIEDRFAARAQAEMGLTDEQFRRLRATTAQYGATRRSIEEEERRMRQGLAAQLRPGVAANQDSVGRLVDGLTAIKTTYANTYRDEMRALSAFLTPVQRAQFWVLRERLLNVAQQVRAQRLLRQEQNNAARRAAELRRRR